MNFAEVRFTDVAMKLTPSAANEITLLSNISADWSSAQSVRDFWELLYRESQHWPTAFDVLLRSTSSPVVYSALSAVEERVKWRGYRDKISKNGREVVCKSCSTVSCIEHKWYTNRIRARVGDNTLLEEICKNGDQQQVFLAGILGTPDAVSLLRKWYASASAISERVEIARYLARNGFSDGEQLLTTQLMCNSGIDDHLASAASLLNINNNAGRYYLLALCDAEHAEHSSAVATKVKRAFNEYCPRVDIAYGCWNEILAQFITGEESIFQRLEEIDSEDLEAVL